ncbi:MAG TPA: response regulator [Puia sp.]|nr:response regulator [Puia sp.]
MHACNILLADSNIGDQYLFKELVHQLDRSWRVHVAPNARQVLQYLNHLTRTDYPAVILMDYALPVRGALELLERLTQDPRYRQIPKFIWSAVGLPGGVEAYLNLGARGFLPKPQKASEAKALVRELLAVC